MATLGAGEGQIEGRLGRGEVDDDVTCPQSSFARDQSVFYSVVPVKSPCQADVAPRFSDLNDRTTHTTERTGDSDADGEQGDHGRLIARDLDLCHASLTG